MKVVLNRLTKRFIAVMLNLIFVTETIFNFPLDINNNVSVKAVGDTLTTQEIVNQFKTKMEDLGWVDVKSDTNNMKIDTVKSAMWYDTSDINISKINADSIKENENAVGWRVDPENGKTIWNYVIKSEEEKVSAYSGSDDGIIPNNQSDEDLYYTIEYDNTLEGYYRRYYINTANQLATLLYNYNYNFDNKLKTATEDEIKGVDKLGIVLLNDIDLGGSSQTGWRGYRNYGVALEIDGQGHKIYNGYMTESNEYFLNVDNKFAIHDVTFSNMFIGRAGGLFGAGVIYAYFNNVNWENCLVAGKNGAATSSSIVLGHSYNYCYFKDCTIENCYLTGSAHTGLFGSYNDSTYYSNNTSYVGDTSEGITKYYEINIPDLENTEKAWYGKNYDENHIYNTSYPSIYENCATIDSFVYDIGGNHSGTFVSCMQSNIIFKNCFSNCTIYARTQQGVFLGSVIGSSDGFYYPYKGEKTFVNAYFENCYTSGVIEGSSRIGGFVGMIFDDTRAYNTLNGPYYENLSYYRVNNYPNNKRGKAVFYNCYSTSSVGMEYTSAYIGGFAGLVIGNDRAEDPDDIQHIFENCYAAGEVGGMTIDVSTDEDNTNSIGGFFGAYTKRDRRDINYFYNSLSDELKAGVTEYIEGISVTFDRDFYLAHLSEINGLFNSINNIENSMNFESGNDSVDLINCYYDKQTTAMRERDIGNYNSNYKLNGTLEGLTGAYTQESGAKNVYGLTDTNNIMQNDSWSYRDGYYPQLSAFENTLDNYSPLAEKMKYERQQKYYNYALASTATVFLDHYDEYIDESGNLVEANQLDNADIVRYDTVRDITSKFEFTSANGINWSKNTTRNSANGYIDTISSDGKGFDLTFTNAKLNEQEKNLTLNFNPDVLKITQDETDGNKFKCFEFAPGRQWLTVTAGNNDEFLGRRDLRLLPTAYLTAGDTITVNVIEETDTAKTVKNEVSMGSTTLSGFKHNIGVAYAITDVNRMDASYTNNNQIVSLYNPDDKTSFALCGGYILGDESTEVKTMLDQEFKVDGQINDSTNGKTIVKIFHTKQEYLSENKFILEMSDEITATNDLQKWSGEKNFEVGDAGYYYMTYYWRLNDGRYLSDNKLVKIKSESHTVEMITGIIDEEYTVQEADTHGFKIVVDHYVTDNDDKPYPSIEEEFNADTVEEYYEEYNEEFTYAGDKYYIKSNMITSSKNTSEVGWYRSNEYELSTLIVKVKNSTGEFEEMTRIDKNSPLSDFNNAEYSYKFSGSKVEQNLDTKLFTVTKLQEQETKFTVKSSGTNGIENYITFEIERPENMESTEYEFNDSFMVIALFRKNDANVIAEKNVLAGVENDEISVLSLGDSKPFDEIYKDYEVDNTGITDNDNRKAVLSEDILTYRIKLHNTGYSDSGEVNVFDEVPEGCEYVENSAKIYRQEKDITSGEPKYDTTVQLVESGYSVTQENGKIKWIIPSVEMNYDYYAEYKVKVKQLNPTVEQGTVKNISQWDFMSFGGDDIKSIFDINISSNSNKAENYTEYEIEIAKKDDVTESYSISSLENTLPFSNIPEVQLLKDDIQVTENISINGNKVTIKNLNFDSGSKYTLKVKGDYQELSKDNPVITNKLDIIYNDVDNTYGATVKFNEKMTNQVETDVTHLYIGIEKEIENPDPSQTFLYKIERFEDSSEAVETFYTEIHCNENSTTGSKLIQVDKRGYYKVTEMTDWSNTDYDFEKDVFKDVDFDNSLKIDILSDNFYMPRRSYSSSKAFPTSMGIIEEGNYPKITFKNNESKYAYVSAQAYAENKIKKSEGGDAS